MTKPIQDIIPQKIIDIAKAINAAKNDDQCMGITIVYGRKWGVKAAVKLSNGEQILPTNLNNDN